FTVRLPVLAGAGAGAPAAEAEAPAARVPPELQGVRVLLVDDATDGRRAIGAVLQRAGALVAEAANSGEAFSALAEFRPHVMVSGLGLPQEDGFSLVARM